MKKLLVPFFLLLMTAVCLAYTSPGKPSGHVNDFAGVLPSRDRQALEQDLRRFAREHSHEISVVTVRSLGGIGIEDYANALFREWGIGSANHNNGALFLIAVDDRKMRIEVGYGLEGALTDIESHAIQEEGVKPYFKRGDLPGGIREGARRIQAAVLEEQIPGAAPAQAWPHLGELLMLLFLLFSLVLKLRHRWYGVYVGSATGFIVTTRLLEISRPSTVGIFTLAGALLAVPAVDYLAQATWREGIYRYLWKWVPGLCALGGFLLSIRSLDPGAIFAATLFFAVAGWLAVLLYRSQLMDLLFSIYVAFALWAWLTALHLFPNEAISKISLTIGAVALTGFSVLVAALVALAVILTIIQAILNPSAVFSSRNCRPVSRCRNEPEPYQPPSPAPEPFKGFGGGSSGGGGSSSSW